MPANSNATSYSWPSPFGLATDGAEDDGRPIRYAYYLGSWLAPLPAVAADGELESVRRLNATLCARGVGACPAAAAPLIGMDDILSGDGDGLTPPEQWADALAEAVQWLCAGVSVADGPPPPSLGAQGLAQQALEHVMAGVPPPPPSEADGALLDGTRFDFAALSAGVAPPLPSSSLLRAALAPSGQFRPSLVLLLFHRHGAVRVWAREQLLDCVYAAADLRLPDLPAAAPAEDRQRRLETERELRERALWALACRLLCALKHLGKTQPPVASAEATRLVGQGVYGVFVALTVLNQKLATAADSHNPQKQQQQSRLPHKATPLLLGGTIVFGWLSRLMHVLAALHTSRTTASSSSSSRDGEAAQLARQAAALRSAAHALLCGLNGQLRRDATLVPASLAADARKAIGMALLHGLLDNAKAGPEAPPRLRHMRQLWAMAAALDAPQGGTTATTTTTGRDTTSIAGTCAAWMLAPLMQNAASQLNLRRAVAKSTTKPAEAATVDVEADALERTVGGYDAMLATLLEAAPDAARSPALHAAVCAGEQDLFAIVAGAVVHRGCPAAVRLLHLVMRVDLLAGSVGRTADPTGAAAAAAGEGAGGGPPAAPPARCLERVWERFPMLLRNAIRLKPPQQRGPSSVAGPPQQHILVALAGVLRVLVDDPAVAGWLLLMPAVDRGPAPIAGQLRRFVDEVLETLRLSAKEVVQQWEAGSPAAALSGLLTGASPLPRTVHRLALAQSPRLRALGDLLRDVFLRSMLPTVHATFATDAAEWLWTQVVLPSPLLLGNGGGGVGIGGGGVGVGAPDEGTVSPPPSPATAVPGAHWLRLHDPAVNNLVRGWGRAWLPLLARCNWGSDALGDSPVHTAAAWWVCALIADVAPPEDAADRNAFIDGVLVQLLAPRPSPPLVPAAAAYAVVRQLLLSLMEGYFRYPPGQLVAAVLHVAGALLPAARVETDTALLATVKARLEKMSQHIALAPAVAALKANGNGNGGKGSSNTTAGGALPATALLQYGPAWLVRAAQLATASVDECLADQERRLRQFEWEETRTTADEALAARLAGQEVARLAAGEAVRSRQLDARAAQSRAAAPARGLATFDLQQQQPPVEVVEHSGGGSGPSRGVTGGAFVAATGAMARPALSATTAPFARHGWIAAEDHPARAKRADPFNDGPATAAAAPRPTAGQLDRQAANAARLDSVQYATSEENVRAQLLRVVGRTDILRDPPATFDIIGTRPGCLAPELPVLPDIFVAARPTHAGRGGQQQRSLVDFLGGGGGDLPSAAVADPAVGALYASSFVPHIALELRWSVVREFGETTRLAPTQGYIREMGAHPGRGNSNNRGGFNGRSNGNGSSEDPDVGRLRQAFPVSRWLVERAAAVTFMPETSTTADPLDASRIDFGIAAHVNPYNRFDGGGPVHGDIHGHISDNDIVLALLPLSTLLPAWHAHTQQQLKSGREVAGPTTADELIAAVPQAWRDLGCFPQVCYLRNLSLTRGPSTLSTYPNHHHHKSTSQSGDDAQGNGKKRSKNGGNGASLSIPFLHALHLGFSGQQQPGAAKAVLFLKRIGTLSGSFDSVRALFGVNSKAFAGTVYDPRTSADRSRVYYERLNRLLDASPEMLQRVRARLLLHQLVNDWQAKAICAVLYAVKPTWDSGPALMPSGARTDGAESFPVSYYGNTGTALSAATANFVTGPTPDILVIEGPPGTGKTQTIATLILNLVHHLPRGSRVLLCAPSNCAVDEALMRTKKLQDQIRSSSGSGSSSGATMASNPGPELCELLRLGVKDNIGDDVLAQSPPLYLDDKVALLGGRGRGDNTRDLKRQCLSAAAMTFSTLGSLNLIRRMCSEAGSSYDVVVIDEASQATEPDVLQALMLAKHRCVLVGDSNQLQPTILCDEAARRGLKRSLLVRLLTNGHQSFGLRTQFRMHPDICHFPNHRYYGGKLLTDRSVLERQRPPREEKRDECQRQAGLLGAGSAAGWTVAQKLHGTARLAFVNVPLAAMQRGRGRSLRNQGEAQAVVAYMRQLRSFLGLTDSEFAGRTGIITFYRAQMDEIRDALSYEERESGLQVATVDSFQGKEKDIILISCVRTADDAMLGRLDRALEALARRAARQKAKARAASTVDVDAAEDDSNGDGDASGTTSAVPSPMGSVAPKRRKGEDGGELEAAGNHSSSDDDDGGDIFGGVDGDGDGKLSASSAADVGIKTLGFLVDRHRVNVALTRAKELCVVFGHEPIIAAGARVEAALMHAAPPRSAAAATAGMTLAAALAASSSGGGGFPQGLDALSSAAAAGRLAVSSAEAVMAKLHRDDADPVALAALITHAAACEASGGLTAPGPPATDDVVIVGNRNEEEEPAPGRGARRPAAVVVHGVVCEYPKDRLIMQKLAFKK